MYIAVVSDELYSNLSEGLHLAGNWDWFRIFGSYNIFIQQRTS